MFRFALVLSVAFLASSASAFPLTTDGVHAVKNAKHMMPIEAEGMDKCSVCFKETYGALDILFMLAGEGATFGGCAKLCSMVPQIPADACMLPCVAVGETAFMDLVKKMELDPIAICQNMHKCPVGDCNGDCVSQPEVHVKVNDIDSDSQQVDFNITYSVDQKWNGTGMFYYQINDGAASGPLVGNQAKLMVFPQPMGEQKIEMSMNLDCAPDSKGNEEQYTFTVMACEGECDEFGPKDKPHTKLFNQTSIPFQGCAAQ